MDDIVNIFDDLKISALSKSMQINAHIKSTTIGPSKSPVEEDKQPAVRNNIDLKPTEIPHLETPMATNTTLVINKFRAEIEKQRQGKVQEAVNFHRNHILEFSNKQKNDSRLQLQRQQQTLIKEMQQQEVLILQVLEQHDKDMSLQHQQLVQYYGELAERRKKIDRELQEREKRRQIINSIIESIKKDQVEFRHAYQEIVNILKMCKFQNQLKLVLADIPKQLKLLPESMEEIVARCKAGRISENESRKSSELVQEIKGLLK